MYSLIPAEELDRIEERFLGIIVKYPRIPPDD